VDVKVANAILKVWRQIENFSPSIDAYLLEEHSCQISSRSNLKRWNLKLFEERHPQQEQEQQDEQ